jgi:hypothetical protein
LRDWDCKMNKLIIGTGITLFIGWILKDTFYKALCENGNFACILGWIAFKSPIAIILIVIVVSIISCWIKKS